MKANPSNNGNVGRSFPSNSYQALAMLYIEKHFDETWSPEELFNEYSAVLSAIEKAKHQ